MNSLGISSAGGSGSGSPGPRGISVSNITFQDNGDGTTDITFHMSDGTTYGPFGGTLINDNLLQLNKISLEGTDETDKFLVKDNDDNVIFNVDTSSGKISSSTIIPQGSVSLGETNNRWPSGNFNYVYSAGNFDGTTTTILVRNESTHVDAGVSIGSQIGSAYKGSINFKNDGIEFTDDVVGSTGKSLGSSDKQWLNVYGTTGHFTNLNVGNEMTVQGDFGAIGSLSGESASLSNSADEATNLIVLSNPSAHGNATTGINFKINTGENEKSRAIYLDKDGNLNAEECFAVKTVSTDACFTFKNSNGNGTLSFGNLGTGSNFYSFDTRVYIGLPEPANYMGTLLTLENKDPGSNAGARLRMTTAGENNFEIEYEGGSQFQINRHMVPPATGTPSINLGSAGARKFLTLYTQYVDCSQYTNQVADLITLRNNSYHENAGVGLVFNVNQYADAKTGKFYFSQDDEFVIDRDLVPSGNAIDLGSTSQPFTYIRGVTYNVGGTGFGDAAMDFDCSAGSGRFSLTDDNNIPYFTLNQRTRIDVPENNTRTVLTLSNSDVRSNAEVALAFTCGTNSTSLKYDGSFIFFDSDLLPTDNENLGSVVDRWGTVYCMTVNESSDANIKNSIVETPLGLDFIDRLKPRKYKFNEHQTNKHFHGLVAQEVKEVLDDLNVPEDEFAAYCHHTNTDDEGNENENYSLQYTGFIAPMIKAIQELSAKVEDLQAQIDAITGQ